MVFQNQLPDVQRTDGSQQRAEQMGGMSIDGGHRRRKIQTSYKAESACTLCLLPDCTDEELVRHRFAIAAFRVRSMCAASPTMAKDTVRKDNAFPLFPPAFVLFSYIFAICPFLSELSALFAVDTFDRRFCGIMEGRRMTSLFHQLKSR